MIRGGARRAGRAARRRSTTHLPSAIKLNGAFRTKASVILAYQLKSPLTKVAITGNGA